MNGVRAARAEYGVRGLWALSEPAECRDYGRYCWLHLLPGGRVVTRYCPDCGDRLLSYVFSGERQPRYVCPACQEGK